MRVGVLALQGGFRPHVEALEALGHDVVLVRDARALASIEGLVLAGGESTAQAKLLEVAGIGDAVMEAASLLPVLGTCAGMILLTHFGLLDVELERNGYGPQLYSFEATSDRAARALVFIRAPRIRSVGRGVDVIDTLDGEPILVRQGRVVGATYHPELTEDRGLYAEIFKDP